MNIRLATNKDIEEIMELTIKVRALMVEQNNPHQWTNNYPIRIDVVDNIKEHSMYVVVNNDEIVGFFRFLVWDDPTYKIIYDGNWLDSSPYGVIHMMGVRCPKKGIGSAILEFCLNKQKHIRIDTHRDNLPMQSLLKKYGFVRTGIIHIVTGDERIAYEKISSN